MTIQQLRAALKAAPFRPFDVHMADGRSFHVPHPDYLLMSPSGRMVFAFGEDDDCSILDLLLMTEVEYSKGTASRSPSSPPQG